MTAVTATAASRTGVEHFRLPDVGEGLNEAEVVAWHIAVGDSVEINQTIVEIETAKSVVELPSPFAGTVTDILVPEGDTVTVGTQLVAIRTADVPAEGDPQTSQYPSEGTPAQHDAAADNARPSVLVGYGPSESDGRRRRRRATGQAPQTDPVPPLAVNEAAAPLQDAPLAKPPVRKLAKDHGVNLTEVVGSGPEGRITREDVLRHVSAENGPIAPARLPQAELPEALTGPRTTPAGAVTETRIPVKGVRKATAAAMVQSAFTAPHVTEFMTVDVTRSVKLVERLKAEPAFGESRVTFLLLVARALLAAVREFPEINASWDAEANEIVRHHQVNLGIAAATPRGLLVPNIKNAESMTLPQLASALTNLVRTARDGRTSPGDMTRGTITITNVGVFGVDSGTPILNPGEAAILCLGAVRRQPWEHKGRVALRSVTQLALSFDHRLIDGELGSKVLARVGAILKNPKWELLLT
ncbi:dihydrolipoamide acetyltransferase family protein [Streptomyces chartreusis]|uniref:Dihydrolipoamide acetyltransferase component of pyruvate dehydrogenase complex n=1 Tax=Streptomyces chartreusis TaxID=1969 RepID=A0A7I0Y8X1_STRCX|nr:dihydrolipoamide acetyltransferase family protein [Streptomyces chartreusis]QKZ15952.1 2-oxo acid dehydrogenase subunit E2 [Streptomyces chartreusis]